MARVSIIVPVYNAEKTIGACIESILKQDFKDFELLLCDDGSNDQSLEICNRYSKTDQRIKVYSLFHQGVSAARNAGISYATGKYIMFADSDDLLSLNWVSFLVAHMTPQNLAICGYSCVDEKGVRLYGAEKRDGQWIDDMKIETKQFIEDVFSNRHMYQGYIWNKIFDASVIRNHNIRFNEHIAYNEDRLFLVMYLFYCQSVNYSNISLYTYSVRTIREKTYDARLYTEIDAFEIMCKELYARRMFSAYKYAREDEIRALSELIPLAQKCCHPDTEKLQYLLSKLTEEMNIIRESFQ